jgi:hypothetical protein
MNTQLAFAFGMLAMVAIIMIAAIVVGLLKVYRHDKEFKNVQGEFGHIHRHITDNERAIYSEISETRNIFDQHTDELRRELQAYTDSRIDKALGTTKKQIIND